jgi:hypothetical protein
MTLAIYYDEPRDIVTIEGIRYSGELFRSFDIAPTGTLLRIMARDDGIVTLQKYAPGEQVTA